MIPKFPFKKYGTSYGKNHVKIQRPLKKRFLRGTTNFPQIVGGYLKRIG